MLKEGLGLHRTVWNLVTPLSCSGGDSAYRAPRALLTYLQIIWRHLTYPMGNASLSIRWYLHSLVGTSPSPKRVSPIWLTLYDWIFMCASNMGANQTVGRGTSHTRLSPGRVFSSKYIVMRPSFRARESLSWVFHYVGFSFMIPTSVHWSRAPAVVLLAL